MMTKRLLCALVDHKPSMEVWALLNCEVPGFIFDQSTEFLIRNLLVRPCTRCGVWVTRDESPRSVERTSGHLRGDLNG